ncbi:MAG: NUDIX domain-containing protein [Ktedonobacteraceae bacterium]
MTNQPHRFKLIGAVHLFLMHDKKILLLRRFNTGYEDGNYSVVAGHLDGDEEIKAAMIREAREEVGIELASGDVQVVGVMHRKSNDERVDFFLAADERWPGELRNCEPDQCDELAWFDLDSLPTNMIPYVRRALANYRAGRWFDSFGWEPLANFSSFR